MGERILINRSLWNKPTYLGHYDDRAEFYEGIRCKCEKCGISFVFTDIEQRKCFETNGKYPGWLPSLCSDCHELWKSLEKKEQEFYDGWLAQEISISEIKNYLDNWLSIAIEADSYRKKGFSHTIGMIKKVLKEIDEGCA